LFKPAQQHGEAAVDAVDVVGGDFHPVTDDRRVETRRKCS
jgi:hypothetical protein